MRKYTTFASKCVTGLLTLSLITSGMASSTVFAEEGAADTEYLENMEGDSAAEAEEVVPSVFVIQRFTDFEKDSEGHFINEETLKKYGDIKALPGTPLDKLELPKTLDLEGYWEADGPDAPAIYTMEELKWKLKSDIGEVYSESSPEGAYTFIPDYEDYVLNEEGLDGIRLDESVKNLELTVTIAPESPAETEVTEVLETEVTDGAIAQEDQPTPDAAIDPVANTTEFPTEETSVEDDGTIDYGKVDPAEAETSGEDIFSGLDTQAISESTGETYSDTPADGIVVIDENSTDETPVTETPASDAPADPVPVVDSEPITESPVTEAPADPVPVADSESITESPVTEAPATEAPATEAPATEAPADPTPVGDPAEINVFFNLLDSNDQLIKDSTGTAYTVSNILLIPNATDKVPEVAFSSLPCGLDLDTVKIQATLTTDTTITYPVTKNDSAASFNNGTLLCKITDNQTEYRINITLTKAEHNWTAATCTTLSTCTVCGATQGELLPHTWKDATCTEPKTCTVCGTTEGDPLGHDWKEATCTAPKTCQRCGATEGDPLGHDWQDATCTTPKTCKRCGATEGKPLGHDMHDDWVTVEESTDTNHGTQERYCHRDNCDYYESRTLNIIANPENNQINNLSQGANYDLNTRLTFTAIGAGTANTKPIDGDVRYIPSTWSIQGTAGSWLDNYTGAFSISKSGTYTVTVTFQKQVYNNGWASTDIADSRSVTFSVGGASADGTTDGVRINPQTGDSTPIVPIIIVMVVALLVIIGLFIYKKRNK